MTSRIEWVSLRVVEFPPMTSRVVAVVGMAGELVDAVTAGQNCGVITEATNFYAEAGGQKSDCGRIEMVSCSSLLDHNSLLVDVLCTVRELNVSRMRQHVKKTIISDLNHGESSLYFNDGLFYVLSHSS